MRGLVMRVHSLTGNHRLNKGHAEPQDDDRLTVKAEIVAMLVRTAPEQRQIIKAAAPDKLSGTPLGDVLWQMVAELDSHRASMNQALAGRRSLRVTRESGVTQNVTQSRKAPRLSGLFHSKCLNLLVPPAGLEPATP